MRAIGRRLLTLLAAVSVWEVLGALIGAVVMGAGWGVSITLGGCVGALLGTLYDPRAATCSVPTRGGGLYPGARDD